MKVAALGRATKEKLADTPYKYLKSGGKWNPKRSFEWQDGALLKDQSSCWMSAVNADTVVVACDAKRLSCPAEDVEVFGAVVRTPGVHFLAWLPPQARYGGLQSTS